MTTTENRVGSVLEAVTRALPTLRANGKATEDERWVRQENIDLLERAGVFRMAVPARFGGLEAPLADHVAVLDKIASACPSTGWVASVWVSSAWLVTQMPDKAQEEVFASGSARVSGGFTPTGSLVPVDGGYRLNGTWKFNTGCRGAQWNLAATILEHPDGTHEEVIALVPMAEFEITDDWHTFAGAGTGSCASTARDVFVPAHRIAGFGDALYGTVGDRSNTGANGRNYGLLAYIMAATVPVLIGIAHGAMELFLERLPGRGISYTDYTDQSAHPLTHLQIATAANKITAAEAMQERWVRLLQERADAGEQPSIEEKVAVRGQAGYAIQLVKEAVEVLFSASGATAVQRAVPIQRFFRDAIGFSMHAFLQVNTNLELHGRVLAGLEPNTVLL